ncbi:MAG: pyridoxal phosphate-dependent aminotransferase, partial [Clostridium sp.]
RKYGISPNDLIDFSANINPMGLNNNVKDEMIKSLSKIDKYPDITYYNLKKSISEYENINYENLFLGNGAAEVIFNIVRGLKPKNVLLPAPTFSEYEEAVLSVDGEVEYYKLQEKDGFSLNSGIINYLNESIDMIFICNPNNPTGVLTKNTFIEKLAVKAMKTKTIIVIDESFLDFISGEEEYTSKTLIEKYTNIIIVKSLTKFFAMPGIRIGYGITSNKEYVNMINKVTVPWSINTVACFGTIKALTEEKYIKDSIKFVEIEKDYLYSCLREIEVIKVFKPSVNFIMFKVLKIIDLKQKMLKENILIRSCDNYEGLDSSFYRIAIRTRSENEKIVKALKLCLL